MIRAFKHVRSVLHYGLTSWAEPELSVSQDHEQEPGAEELGEAQREVSGLRVGVVPAVTRRAAEPPQEQSVQPAPDRHQNQNIQDSSNGLWTKPHLQLTIVYATAHLLEARKWPFFRATALLRYLR